MIAWNLPPPAPPERRQSGFWPAGSLRIVAPLA
jgi:hypothetical protein